MIPLGKRAPERFPSRDDAPHRSIALGHALLHDRPGLWGHDARHPTGILWIREGDDGGWEAFASGVPGPALGWLASRSEGRTVALLAPPSWEGPVRARGGRVEVGTIRTWVGLGRPGGLASRVEARRLTPGDGPAFEAVAPSWALRSWGDFPTLLERGLAFGIPAPGGFASLAWTYESDHAHDKIGVATSPRCRRLGLGRMVASTLVDRIVSDRRKLPVWVTTPANTASIALARSLGFSTPTDETLLRWTPHRG